MRSWGRPGRAAYDSVPSASGRSSRSPEASCANQAAAAGARRNRRPALRRRNRESASSSSAYASAARRRDGARTGPAVCERPADRRARVPPGTPPIRMANLICRPERRARRSRRRTHDDLMASGGHYADTLRRSRRPRIDEAPMRPVASPVRCRSNSFGIPTYSERRERRDRGRSRRRPDLLSGGREPDSQPAVRHCPVDVPTLAGVGGLLAASAFLASYVPARRAASVNPITALRAE